MDCLEFRRLLGSDPRVTDPAARAHLDACPFCADACERAQAFESRLAGALAVAVPEGLADRIVLAQLTATRQRERTNRRRFAWIALAAAASLALAVGLWRRFEPPSLQQLVADHVTAPDELSAWSLTAALPDTEVRKAFADRGVELASVPAGVVYAGECPVGPWRTVHMVMPREGQPVSVVYVVQHRAPANADFERDGLRGREVPIRDGTLVMLAKDERNFGAITRVWQDAIDGGSGASATGEP